LSGLAFNASDLEGAINELNRSVQQVKANIEEHNHSIHQLGDLIREGEGYVRSGEESLNYTGK